VGKEIKMSLTAFLRQINMKNPKSFLNQGFRGRRFFQAGAIEKLQPEIPIFFAELDP